MMLFRGRVDGPAVGAGCVVGDRGAVDSAGAASQCRAVAGAGGRPGGAGGDRVRHPGGLFVVEAARSLFGVTRATAHRRFAEWTAAGLWLRLHQAVLDRLGGGGRIDWSRAVVDSISVRAEKGAI